MAESSRNVRRRKEPVQKNTNDFDSTHLANPEFLRRFYHRFASRAIPKPFYVALSFLHDLRVCNKSIRVMFHDMGWETFISLRLRQFPAFVRVFYSNTSHVDSARGTFRTSIGGREITITPALINELISAPNEGLQFYTHRKWPSLEGVTEQEAVQFVTRDSRITELPKAQLLPLQSRIILKIVQFVLQPRMGHPDAVKFMDLALLYCIMRGIRVNLGFIIVHQMITAISNSNAGLPFGSLITCIANHYQIPIRSETVFSEPLPIDVESVRDLGFHWVDNSWEKDRRQPQKKTAIAAEDMREMRDLEAADPFFASASATRTRGAADPPDFFDDAGIDLDDIPDLGTGAGAAATETAPDTESFDMRAMFQTITDRQDRQDRRLGVLESHIVAIMQHLGIPIPPPPPPPPSSSSP